MRTLETVLYHYQELSQEAQSKAVENMHSLNVDYDWWDGTYGDADNINAKISSFALDRQWTIELELQECVGDTVRAIIRDHGKECSTHELAREYYRRKHIGVPMDVAEFTQQLGECYLQMLDREYDYLTGDEAIVDTILANEYEFTDDGELV